MNDPTLHHYFVTTIPKMVHIMSECDFPIGSPHLVQITHINQFKSFYVRPLSLRYCVKLLENKGPPLPLAELITGKNVGYESRIVGHFVRGRIQTIDQCERGLGTVCSILAIDYGAVDHHVFVKELYLPGKDSEVCGPLAFHCELNISEMDELEFGSEAGEAMRVFSKDYISQMVIQDKTSDKFKVLLRSLQYPEDISAMLNQLSLTKFIIRMNENVAFRSEPIGYVHRELKMGDKLHVRVQYGNSVIKFYAAEIEEYKSYDNVIEWYKFTKYCMEQPAANVIAALDGRPVAVKVLNPVRYERAVIMEANVDTATADVQLVDWGKEINVKFEDIKPVGKEFNKCPPMAMYFTAEMDLTTTAVMGAYRILPGDEFKVVVLHPGNGFDLPHRVKLYAAMPSTTTPELHCATNDELY